MCVVPNTTTPTIASRYDGKPPRLSEFLDDLRAPFRNARTFFKKSRFGDHFGLFVVWLLLFFFCIVVVVVVVVVVVAVAFRCC